MFFKVVEIEPETWRIVRVFLFNDRTRFFVVLSSQLSNARRLSSFRVRYQISNDVVIKNCSDLTDQKKL